MDSRFSALAFVIAGSLVGCGAAALPPPLPEARPAPALVVAHPDPTLLVHVDLAALRASPLGPAAGQALLSEIGALGSMTPPATCGGVPTIELFDDLVVSVRGGSVRLGAAFAKGALAAAKDACARELGQVAERRDELVVAPPRTALDPGMDRAHLEARFSGGRIAKIAGKLGENDVDGAIDSDADTTALELAFRARTPIRARELAERIGRLVGAPVAAARRTGDVDEAHVVRDDAVLLAVRLRGPTDKRAAAARLLAAGLASASVGELVRDELPVARARLGTIADAIERTARADGGVLPATSPWVPGVTPRAAKVPIVGDGANDRSWVKIGISWRNEHTAFRYRFVTADDGKSATVEAHGDLDGDEKESTLRVVLTKKADGTIVRGPIEELDPAE